MTVIDDENVCTQQGSIHLQDWRLVVGEESQHTVTNGATSQIIEGPYLIGAHDTQVTLVQARDTEAL